MRNNMIKHRFVKNIKHEGPKPKLFNVLIILSILLISLYTINQKDHSMQIRYEIANLEQQNRDMTRVSKSIAVKYYKDSSILKLQKIAMNDGLIYFNNRISPIRKIMPYKPILVALERHILK